MGARQEHEHGLPAFPASPDATFEGRLTAYLLNPEHQEGKTKLRLFETSFGINASEPGRCAEMLLEASRRGTVENVKEREDCITYAVRTTMTRTDGTTREMRIVWKKPHDSDDLVFITAYPAPRPK